MMLVSILLLIAGFGLLIFGASFLVNGATNLAARLGVSDLVIGLTVVAFGTSLPELTVNTFNSVNGLNDAVFGNVIGSNVFNMLFILGITGLIFPIIVDRRTVAYEVPLSILITVVLLLLVNDHIFGQKSDVLTLVDALILMACFVVFIIYIFRSLKSGIPEASSEIKLKPIYLSVLFIIAGLGMMVYGGYQTTENAVFIASKLGMSEKLIALTILSIGTSLPELATSAVAAYKRNASIAVGNVVGSNIFNIAFILSISGFIHPVNFDAVMNKDMLVLLFGSSLLMLAMFTGGRMKLDRWEAAILLITYILYTVYIIQRN
jgi:cation:H+ antiporter